MPLKRIGLMLAVLISVIAMYGPQLWRQHHTSEAVPARMLQGPAVILFRGDNDPGCRRIYQLVEDAATQHDKRIQFIRENWSDDNPLITQYRIRFLPSVIFIDQHGREKLRIVGESPAVQHKLQQALARLEQLLAQ
jgi:hypothetical protein